MADEKKYTVIMGVGLKELLKDQGITQKQLADKIPISQQTINKAATGKQYTRKLAEDIQKLFPQYQLGWLLGTSDFKTESEERSFWKSVDEFYRQERNDALIALINGTNYEFDDGSFWGDQSAPLLLKKKRSKAQAIEVNKEWLQELEEEVKALISYQCERAIRKAEQQKTSLDESAKEGE